MSRFYKSFILLLLFDILNACLMFTGHLKKKKHRVFENRLRILIMSLNKNIEILESFLLYYHFINSLFNFFLALCSTQK